MYDDEPSAEELMLAWQDASRAAELADRLARTALDTSEQLTANAAESEKIATLAEQTAVTADETATTARLAATRAHEVAERARLGSLADANDAALQAREAEITARERLDKADRTTEKMPS